MTRREAAIVMAYTGTTMLTGDDFIIFCKYCDELLGFPIWTHEYPHYADAIKEKSKPDFIRLCQSLTESEKAPMPQINVIYCKDCKYFRAYTDGTYGNCTRTVNHGAVYRKNDYCSYAELPIPDVDDHDKSGLIDE